MWAAYYPHYDAISKRVHDLNEAVRARPREMTHPRALAELREERRSAERRVELGTERRADEEGADASGAAHVVASGQHGEPRLLQASADGASGSARGLGQVALGLVLAAAVVALAMVAALRRMARGGGGAAALGARKLLESRRRDRASASAGMV